MADDIRVAPSEDAWSGSWGRPEPGTRRDIIGVRDMPDGRQEYLMHNEALCRPYYLSVSAPPRVAPSSEPSIPADLNGDEFLREFVKDYYRHPNQPVIQPNTRGMRALADYSVERIGRAEDRIAELEGALRLARNHIAMRKPEYPQFIETLDAALAAPSGVKPKEKQK